MSDAPAKAVSLPARAGLGASGGLALLGVLTLLWGLNWPMMKLAVGAMPVLTFRTICLLGAGLGFVVICRLAGQSFRIPRGELRPLLIVSLFNITLWHICSAAGLQHMAASRATIVAFTMPLWAAVLAVPVLHERPTRTTILGLAVGLAGMATLILPQGRSLLVDPLGPLFMIVAAVSWAIGTVAVKRFRFTMPVTALTGWQLLLGGIPVTLGALLFDRGFDPGRVSSGVWLATGYSVVVATLFCHWAWFKLVQRFRAVAVAVGSLAIPVVGVSASAIGLGEPLGWDIFIALLLVLIALFLVLILPGLRAEPGIPERKG